MKQAWLRATLGFACLLTGRGNAEAVNALTATATLLTERGTIVVNIAYQDQHERKADLVLVCADGQSQKLSKQVGREQLMSVEIQLPPGCRMPIVDFSDISSSGSTIINNEVRLFPAPYLGVPNERLPAWAQPLLIAALASATTLLSAFLGARWTQKREESKAKFDLRRSIVEREIAACGTVLQVCGQMPALAELEAAMESKLADFTPEGPIIPAYYKLRQETSETGHLGNEIVQRFALVVQNRRNSLLEPRL